MLFFCRSFQFVFENVPVVFPVFYSFSYSKSCFFIFFFFFCSLFIPCGMSVFGTCPTSSVEGRDQEFVKQRLSLLLCPPGSLLVAIPPPLLAGSYSSTQAVSFLPAPCTALLPLPSPDLFSGHACAVLVLMLQLASKLLSCAAQPCASPSPLAQKVPFDFSRNICPVAVLRGRNFLLPFFQFSLRW